ncbi:LacI family DNA-binding transcriptional regulator [Pseudoprimorskyibacter insulae]|uniref:HTH-type transcriptional regulator GntR n=1 Tax=Pseudoprimorskyibacter insulae TaxID=1695997 RepID=A0A2R8APM8_9RHOB|nr:LacI family DNA-binding transcriptional regulator [Pseudoprimorskyibacter insulae]SPF78012.1 HTH-type transcriptional regulator GntR [Pseudoprimorskyibacter insulae]
MALEKKWVTMGDVAREAGVGTITVSRVIRTPTKVSQTTRDKVQAAIAKLGYVPDETAGALSSQRSRMVGALVSTLEASIFASTIEGLSTGLRAEGYQLLLGNTEYEPETEASLAATMLGRRPDALVLTSDQHTEAARTLMNRAGVPVIELWELPESPIHAAIGFSNAAAGEAITRHLVETGRKRIAFIGPDRANDRRGQLRQSGYLRAIAGQEPRVALMPADLKGAGIGAAGLAQILERYPDTDAVVCVSDAIALGAYCEAMRRGLSVPRDLALTGFGDFDLASDAGLALTTLRIDGHAIGAKAADLILSGTKAAPLPPTVIDMGFELIRRGTS